MIVVKPKLGINEQVLFNSTIDDSRIFGKKSQIGLGSFFALLVGRQLNFATELEQFSRGTSSSGAQFFSITTMMLPDSID